MKIIDNALALFGLTPGRGDRAPQYRAIADGLIVTHDKAEAWFEVRPSNSDTMTDAQLVAEVRNVINVAGTALRDSDSHLRIIWSAVEGRDYLRRVAGVYTAGEWEKWAEARARYVDRLNLPRRHVLIGVTIAEHANHAVGAFAHLAAGALDLDQHRVSDATLAHYFGLAAKIGKQLRSSRLRLMLAPAETLAWSITRELHRDLQVVPRQGLIVGAAVATLGRGRVVPRADHLEVLDEAGEVVAYKAVLPMIDFPEEMETPGDGDYLRTLSDVTRINDETSDDAGLEEPVNVDASVRFRVMSRSESLKVATETYDLAKEQKRHAARNSAGEVPQAVLDAEAVSEGLMRDIRSDGDVLVRVDARLVVTGATLDELEANIVAVTAHYAGRGITVVRGTDEQRELWLETLPGDKVRVEDLAQYQTGAGFFGSLFWGGSYLSKQDGPGIGHLTGSTPGIARFDITEFARRGKSTTVACIGRSGVGKTTLMQLVLLDAVFAGGWAMLLDWKGDTSGVVTAAKEYGLPSNLFRVTPEHSGAMDLMRSLPPHAAGQEVARQLALLSSPDQRGYAERVALKAANAVLESEEEPSTWAVIQWMLQQDDEQTKSLGDHLLEQSRTPIGTVILGKPTGKAVFTNRPGLWAVQLPGLTLPKGTNDPAAWDMSERLAVAAMRAVTAYATHMSTTIGTRSMPKVIGIPEVHRMLGVSGGDDFLDTIARMGRAFSTSLFIDSQDAEGIAAHEGLAEQLAAVFVFHLQTAAQQDAAAELLLMPADEDSREIIGSLSDTNDAANDADAEDPGANKGFALMRIGNERAAIHVDLPSERIRELLDTNPDTAIRPDEVEPAA